MNYTRSLIAVADDCPVSKSVVPEPRAGKATVATLQFEMLDEHPYEYTQEDVLFESWLRRQPGKRPPDSALPRLWREFFAKDQPCLRSSPLPKKYGWGLLFDEQGRVALCPMESREYQRLVQAKGGGVTVMKALRSSKG